MTGAELASRVGVWGLVAVFFAGTVTGALIVPDGWWPLVGFAAFPVVGAVIVTAQPRNAVGWLLLAVSVPWGPVALTSALGTTAPSSVELLAAIVQPVTLFAVPALVVVFPAGRTTTRTGRALALCSAAVAVGLAVARLVSSAPLETTGRPSPTATGLLGAADDLLVGWAGTYAVALLLVVSLAELVARWRRSIGAERLQFRWFAFGVAVTLGVLLFSILADAVSIESSPSNIALAFLSALLLNAIPVSIGIAVTRHGLYSIGRVISRTVSYLAVTLVAVAVYAFAVTSVTWLLPGASSVAVAAATLAAAAVFLPLLRAVQRRLDRRFDRERYDTARIVDDFGEHLRTAAGTAAVTPRLVEAAERTLQPTAIGLWTAGDRDPHRDRRSSPAAGATR